MPVAVPRTPRPPIHIIPARSSGPLGAMMAGRLPDGATGRQASQAPFITRAQATARIRDPRAQDRPGTGRQLKVHGGNAAEPRVWAWATKTAAGRGTCRDLVRAWRGGAAYRTLPSWAGPCPCACHGQVRALPRLYFNSEGHRDGSEWPLKHKLRMAVGAWPPLASMPTSPGRRQNGEHCSEYSASSGQ